jgi:hypothetical protein
MPPIGTTIPGQIEQLEAEKAELRETILSHPLANFAPRGEELLTRMDINKLKLTLGLLDLRLQLFDHDLNFDSLDKIRGMSREEIKAQLKKLRREARKNREAQHRVNRMGISDASPSPETRAQRQRRERHRAARALRKESGPQRPHASKPDPANSNKPKNKDKKDERVKRDARGRVKGK